MRKRLRSIIVALISIAIVATIAWATNGPYPSVGLYWYNNADPTAGGGMTAPSNQLLIRTDSPSIYYKSGTANTAWTRIGTGTASGGTVTSITCSPGMTCTPNPIVGMGSIAWASTGTATHLLKWLNSTTATDAAPTEAGGILTVPELARVNAGQTTSSTTDLVGALVATLTAGSYADPPYSGTSPPIFSGLVGKSVAAASVLCSGVGCGETAPLTCGIRGVLPTPLTGWNNFPAADYGACADSSIVNTTERVGVSVIVPLVTTASGALTLQPAANQHVSVGDPGGVTAMQDDTWVGGNSPQGNAGAHKFNAVDVASSGVPTTLASAATVDACFVHGANTAGLAIARPTNDSGGAKLTFYKTRSTDASVATAVQNGDVLGQILAEAASTTTIVAPAGIQYVVDGAVGAGSVPTDTVFYTGSTGIAEFLRGYPDQHSRFIGPLDMNNTLVDNVLDPVSAQDAATKHFIVTNSASLATTTTQGTVPASGGGTAKFFRSDLTWAAPTSTGTLWTQVLSSSLTGGSLTGWNQRAGTWTASGAGFTVDDGSTNPYLTYESGGTEAAPFPQFGLAIEVDFAWTASAETTNTIQIVLLGPAGVKGTGTLIGYVKRDGTVIGANVQGGADSTINPALGTFTTGVFHTLRVSTMGGVVTVILDGTLYTNSYIPPTASVATRVGLVSNLGHATFKNIKIFRTNDPAW